MDELSDPNWDDAASNVTVYCDAPPKTAVSPRLGTTPPVHLAGFDATPLTDAFQGITEPEEGKARPQQARREG